MKTNIWGKFDELFEEFMGKPPSKWENAHKRILSFIHENTIPKEVLEELKGVRLGLDGEDGVSIPKERVLIEYDNDWHTFNGLVDKIINKPSSS